MYREVHELTAGKLEHIPDVCAYLQSTNRSCAREYFSNKRRPNSFKPRGKGRF